MNVRYRVGDLLAHNTVRGVRSFLLTNRAGSYYYNNWSSQHGGWFVTDDKNLFRVLAEVRIPAPKVSEVVHLLHAVEHVRNSLREKFVLPFGEQSFVYRTSTPQDIDFIFDIRKSNDTRQGSRLYNWMEHKNKTVLHFTKKTNAEEDETNGLHEFDFFVVLNKSGKILKKWEERQYTDQQHSSSVYRGVRVWDSEVILTAGTDLNVALRANKRVEQQLQSILQRQRDYIKTFSQSSLSLCVARTALDSMFAVINNSSLWTTLPVARTDNLDQLIASRGFFLSGEKKMVKRLLLKQLHHVMQDARLPLRDGIDEKLVNGVEWLFFRLRDVVGIFDLSEKKLVVEKCVKFIELLRERYTKNDLVYMNGFAPVSHQALRCALYKTAFMLTKNIVYKRYEEALRTKIRSLFWDGRILKSGVTSSVAGDLFVAAYVYPELLNQKEWCASLLQSDSGGHRWQRHLEAIVLHRFDPRGFKKRIEKIYTDSENDLLWDGCVGMSSDSSEASAVSAATFLELCGELEK